MNKIVLAICVFVTVNLFSQTSNPIIKPKCVEKDLSAGDSYGSLVKTSFFDNFKTILTIEKCSSGGQYSGFIFEMFKKQNEKYIKVENKLMFKESQDELLQKINNLFKEKHDKLSKDAEVGKCYTKTLPFITLKDIGMSMCGEKIAFYAPYEFNEDCQCGETLDPIMVEMNFVEIEPYLNK